MDSELARGFIRGELPPETLARWEAHLINCKDCQETIERERSLAGLLKLGDDGADAERGSDHLDLRVTQGVGDQSRVRRWTPYAPAAVLAALLGVALGLSYRLAVPPPAAVPRVRPDAVSPAEREIIARLDALTVLARDPWLADDYETVHWLETLIDAEDGG